MSKWGSISIPAKGRNDIIDDKFAECRNTVDVPCYYVRFDITQQNRPILTRTTQPRIRL